MLDASDEVDDAFPDALKDPILRKVQFSTISRLDHLVDHVHEEFKNDFFPGENIVVKFDDGGRAPALVREKTKFLELYRPDGSVERTAFARYVVSFLNRPDEEAAVDTAHLTRDRKTFTKQRLRSFLKKTIDHEPWAGAPWCVKSKIAEEYRINTDVPPHLTYENQVLQRKAMKKNDFEGQLVSFHPGLPQLKPKGQRNKRTSQDPALLNEAYQRALAADPGFSKIPQAVQQQHIEQLVQASDGFVQYNGFHPIAAKGHPKPPPPPPPPKYPIEDLELTPIRDKATRPAFKLLSVDVPVPHPVPEELGSAILMRSVGPLLETWDTLNVYCEVFQLDSFTFDDYIEALQLTDDAYHCQLLVEIHCAVLKKLVNDVSDKNGQVQVSLPESNFLESENSSLADESALPTPTPEPEVKPAARTTRSSLAKSEAAELKSSLKNGQSPVVETKVHRVAEMEQSTRSYDWKTRLRKRDFREGRWIYIIVGLLYQLSSDPRRRKKCDDILYKLAPPDQEATVEAAISRYASVDINTRVKILEILCMLSLETKAIRNYMEDCNNTMTELRKERVDMQKKRKAAMEDLRLLHEERKILRPESRTASPILEIEEPEDSKMTGGSEDEAEDEDGAVMDSDEEAPHQGRSLRRAHDRAAQRQKRVEEERLRKERAQAEKAKKPSKQEKRYERILKKIEEAKEQIREYEDEVVVIENDLREADCPRTRVLGKDRFWNRYYWFERNAMPYAGLPDSSTAFAGYANGCLWVQGPDDMERQGFIELCDAENAQYYKAFMMTVPERKMIEEGETHCFNARQWGYYDEPDELDSLIGWLDSHGVREIKLRKELQAQRDKISTYMIRRKEFLESSEEKRLENGEVSRISTRTKTYRDPSAKRRCFAWANLTAERENGHIHSEPKPPPVSRKQAKAAKKPVEEEGRQTRATNRQGKPLTRQGTRKLSGTLNMKKSIAKNVKPKNADSKAGTRTPSPNSPSVNGNDTESRASVPASQPGEDGTQMVRCKHCKKPVPKSSTNSHFKTCPEKKNKDKILKKKGLQEGSVKPAGSNEDKESEALGDDSPTVKPNGEAGHGIDGISSAKGVIKSVKKSAAKDTTASTNDNSSKKTKKRKADMEGDKEPKKKKLKKDEPPKPKVPKPKGPVDVEKQCGVLLPNGGYCARSLTCKSHSMGAKRAVPGRSMPYDFLLAQYQKKNQAKQQKAAMDANAPLVDDTDAHAPVDSDEEKDAVMAAIARSRPQPLAQHVPIGLRRKHQRIRVKDALANALAGNRGGNLFAIRPPQEAGSNGPSQTTMAATAAGTGASDGGSISGGGGGTAGADAVTGSPGGIVPGGGGQQNDGGGGLERPNPIQQALDANTNGTVAEGVGGGGAQPRKSSTAGAATIA
ncbi:MAG: hypothetical protein Q9216_000326 [Gyalolechia sp. 2 TL-2023]